MDKNIYLNLVLNEIPRLLSLLDRNENSPTYGCFDKNYWKYKITDYVNIRFQEACLTLALLSQHQNKFLNIKNLKDYSIAAIKFWTKIQNDDGSFNEYMPNEHSHVATVFSTYCVANTCLLLKIRDQDVLESLQKAAKWISRNDDLIVVNHDAGAVATLYSLYELFGKKKYLIWNKDKLKKVLNNQNSEGWFSEYGGADIGYQSFSIYYLADYYKRSGDKTVLNSLNKAVDFFSYFIHPDYSIGGHYGSRETSFVIPDGFEILSVELPLASSIANAIRNSLNFKRIIGPYSFDDRFLASGVYPYLQAYADYKKTKYTELPKDKKEFEKYFKNAGIYVRNTKPFYLIVNLKKGGVMKVFNKENLLYNDTGWIIESPKKLITTNGPSSVNLTKDSIEIKGSFFEHDLKYQTTSTLLMLRFLNSIGFFNKTKSFLRKKLVTKIKTRPIKFYRKIIFQNDQIKIIDSFESNEKIKNLALTHNHTYLYSTSTGLYEIIEPKKSTIKIPLIEKKGKIEIIITPEEVSFNL
jgi:hypothetical protein